VVTLADTPPVLVIGLGSTLRGDDAIGRLAATRLRPLVDPQTVKVIDVCAPTPELAVEIAAARRVIFLDASVDGPSGQVAVRALTAPATAELLGHHLNPGGLLALAQQLYGQAGPAWTVSFRGESFDLSDAELSPAASAACEAMVAETLRLISG